MVSTASWYILMEKMANLKKQSGSMESRSVFLFNRRGISLIQRIKEARLKVLAGKVSPVVYYMEKILADPMNLSMMAGIPIWTVKLHFKPWFFKRMGEKNMKKYAEAFNITVEQIKNVE